MHKYLPTIAIDEFKTQLAFLIELTGFYLAQKNLTNFNKKVARLYFCDQNWLESNNFYDIDHI